MLSCLLDAVTASRDRDSTLERLVLYGTAAQMLQEKVQVVPVPSLTPTHNEVQESQNIIATAHPSQRLTSIWHACFVLYIPRQHCQYLVLGEVRN